MPSSKERFRGQLAARRLIVGVSGGIAAYKAASLVRLFRQAGAEVQVLMTPDAARFITPLTLGTLSGRDVLTDVFPDSEEGGWTRHIHLGRWADLLIVAPATAQTIAKMAHGACDSMLTATALAARCPILVCPAMDHDMYLHPATSQNITVLRGFGYQVLDPEYGELASGLVGHGRLPEPETIVAHVIDILAKGRPLSGKHVLISAGPTQEAIDPVRYLSNHSSGKMGYAIATVARSLGARVTLVAGPTSLADPEGVEVQHVVSASEMKTAILARSDGADIVVMAAAIADYTPSEPASSKLKKTSDEFVLRMTPTDDILKQLGTSKRSDQTIVGFALETERPLEYAREKLHAKNCDYIVLNNPHDEGAAFGSDTNRVTILTRDGSEFELPVMSKMKVAQALFQTVLDGRPEKD